MLKLENILGDVHDHDMEHRLHHLEHDGTVEFITLSRADTQRHRLRTQTDRGTECAIVVPRDQHLFDGAVLLLEAKRAVVVRVEASQWLRFVPRDTHSALELGCFAGNLHWRVRFDQGALLVAVEHDLDYYFQRLQHFFDDGRAVHVKDAG
ncbi:MAG: urease accessory protein UreE [Betaproteobacteria bacterium]|nr:urease accessory protein UreE [Betaproteobacteria bacterium]